MRRNGHAVIVAAVAAVVILAANPRLQTAAESAQLALPPAKARALERFADDERLSALRDARLEPGALHPSGVLPGRIAVRFDDSYDAARVQSLSADHGATTVELPAFADFHVLRFGDHEDVIAIAGQIAREPGVIYAEPLPVARPLFVPDDPFYSYQWNFHQLEMDRVWEINRGSAQSVVVAVLDGGVAFKTTGTSYLQATDLTGTHFVPGFDFIWDDDVPIDFDGHGTHVTGTIAQSTNNGQGVAGLAFNVSVMPVKVIGSLVDLLLGAPTLGSAAEIARAIRFAADNGARVINMSLSIGSMPSTPIRDALQFAVDRGAVVVIAAGNSGEEGSPPSYPAVYARDMDGVIAVGATEYRRQRAPYSNVNDYVEIVAPGGETAVDRNGDGMPDGILQQTLDLDAALMTGRFDTFVLEPLQGTSMAAPHVTGLVALLMDQGLTEPRVIEAALKRFATDLGPAGRDNEYGYGLINPRGMLRGLGISR